MRTRNVAVATAAGFWSRASVEYLYLICAKDLVCLLTCPCYEGEHTTISRLCKSDTDVFFNTIVGLPVVSRYVYNVSRVIESTVNGISTLIILANTLRHE